jgi:hypothetical protein
MLMVEILIICLYVISGDAALYRLWHTHGMSDDNPKNKADAEASKADLKIDDTSAASPEKPKEIGGRGGLDPTRYGDWEKAGRCIDF